MFLFLLFLAVSGEAPDDDTTIAKGFDRTRPDNSVAAVVHYEDTILIVSTKQGVAAIQFTKPIDSEGRTGMEYRYRFLETGKDERTGTGSVFTHSRGMLPEERIAKGLDPESDEPERVDRTLIRAGTVEIVWSGHSPEKGYFYYVPEATRVQIASGVKKASGHSPFEPFGSKPQPEPLFKHDLKRFAW